MESANQTRILPENTALANVTANGGVLNTVAQGENVEGHSHLGLVRLATPLNLLTTLKMPS